MKVRIKRAANGETFWSVQSANNRKIATAGESFRRPAGSRKAFTTLAAGIRAMTEPEFVAFMAGLNEKVSE